MRNQRTGACLGIQRDGRCAPGAWLCALCDRWHYLKRNPVRRGTLVRKGDPRLGSNTIRSYLKMSGVREEAANLLSALASDAATRGTCLNVFYPEGNWSRAACEVANFTCRVDHELTQAERLAEAEARIRDGSVARL